MHADDGAKLATALHQLSEHIIVVFTTILEELNNDRRLGQRDLDIRKILIGSIWICHELGIDLEWSSWTDPALGP